MKFLLTAVNAKYIHSNPGIYSLKAYAGVIGVHVEIAEYTINHAYDHVLRDIYLRRPQVIGFSCYIWNITYIEWLVKALHRLLPEVDIWLGGPEVTYAAAAVLKRMPGARGVMRGEGEAVFREVLAAYVERFEGAEGPEARTDEAAERVTTDGESREQVLEAALKRIEGITYRRKEEIHENPDQPPLDMSTIPYLYQDHPDFTNKIVYYESSRGCPFRCSYCLSSVDKRVRFRSLELVFSELQGFLDARLPQVKFVDRTFNCKKEHGLAIWRYLLEHDNGVTNFHFEVSADLIGEEELALIAQMRPGLIQLEIGVQSTNAQTLAAIRRNVPFARIAEMVRRVQAFHNTHQHLDLIVGLPYEDYDSFGRSFDEVYALRPDQLQLGFLKVLRGSHMYEEAPAYGIVWNEEPPYEVLYTKWLSYEEVLRLKVIEEMVEVYYNSGQFRDTMEVLLRQFASPFRMYEALGEYYVAQGLYGQSFSRQKRYDIVSEFAKVLNFTNYFAIQSVLRYDLYLRENLKNPPPFIEDQQCWREAVRAFFRAEEKKPHYLQDRAGESAKQLMHDAHVEVFPVDLPLLLADGTVKQRKTAILFDYQKRNPLTKDAWTTEVGLHDEGTEETG